MTGPDVNPYTMSTTEDIHTAAGGELNRTAARNANMRRPDGPSTTPATAQTKKAISAETISGWTLWTFAWVRCFYVTAAQRLQQPTLKLAYEDCCAVNVETLLHQFRQDEALHGRINASMLRIGWLLCRTRLLIASMLYLVVATSWILLTMLCLNRMMHTSNEIWQLRDDLETISSDDNIKMASVVGHNSTADLNVQLAALSRVNIDYTVAYVLIVLALVGVRSAANALTLRAAIMLRNACAGAVFQAAVSSSVTSGMASHQMMALCAEDGQALVDMVLKGVLIGSHSLAMLLCILVGVIQLGAMVFIGLIGLSLIVLLTTLMAMSSRQFYRKSATCLGQKLSIVEEFFAAIRMHDHLTVHAALQKRFAVAVSGQFWALFRAESLRPTFSGAMTVYFLMGCIVAITSTMHFDDSSSANVMALTYLFATVVHFLMADWGEALMALMKGQLVLDRVQSCITRSYPAARPTVQPDHADRILLLNAQFRWDHPLKVPQMESNMETIASTIQRDIEKSGFKLTIDRMCVPKTPAIIGITGMHNAGKSSLVHALLGHMPQRAGEFHCASRVAFYPEQPYILEGSSLRQNICWSNVGAFDEQRYSAAVSAVQMRLNTGYDLELIDRAELDVQWLQKISLARAVYNGGQEIVVLQHPLSGLDSSTETSDIFGDVAAQLLLGGKSVVVVSQDDNILRHCTEIHLLENDQLNGVLSYAALDKTEAFQAVRTAFKQERMNRRNGGTLHSLQTAINISTEDLVRNQPDNMDTLPNIFNFMETSYLVVVSALNVFLQVGLPLTEVMFMHTIPSETRHFIALAIVMMCFMATLVLTSGLFKHYTHRIGRRVVKQIQKDIFDKLMRSPVEPAAIQSQLVYALNTFLEGNFKAFQCRSASLHSWMAIILSICMPFMFDDFFVVPFALLLVDFAILYYSLRSTVAAAGQTEYETRLRLFQHVHNETSNRAVLQSADCVLQSRNRIFNLIEDNSAAVYLQRSLVFFAQTGLDLAQSIGLVLVFVTLHFDPHRSDYSYLVMLYFYNIVVTHLNALLDQRFTKIVADLKIVHDRKFAATNDGLVAMGGGAAVTK